MFEDIPGRLVSGALWGLGAGVVLSVMGGRNRQANTDRARTAVRPLTKSVMKAFIATSDRVRDLTAETRENLGDLYAEAKAERDANGATAHEQSDGAEGHAGNDSIAMAEHPAPARRTRRGTETP